MTRSRTRKALLTLVVLALLAVVLQSIVFSGASFTSSSGNPGNAFTAGSFGHVNSKDGQIVLSPTDMYPGCTAASGTFTITGTGDVSGSYALTKSAVVETADVSSALTLTVQDVTSGTTISSTTVAAFTTADLGTIASGEARQYRLTLAYPVANADPAIQGGSMTLTLDVAGVSQ